MTQRNGKLLMRAGPLTVICVLLSGTMTREPLAQSGRMDTGTWKLNANGFCSTWRHAKPSCFTVIPKGENKWLIQKTATTIATTVAVWSK
jgi:hypothetical protein